MAANLKARLVPGGAAELLRPGSVKADAAVDVDGLAGDEAAVVADQKQAGCGDLVDISLPADREARVHLAKSMETHSNRRLVIYRPPGPAACRQQLARDRPGLFRSEEDRDKRDL